MKRTLSITMIVWLFSAAAAHAQTLREVAVVAQAAAHDATAGSPDTQGSAAAVMSRFNSEIVKSFHKAWYHAGMGNAPIEAVVLIIRNVDGSCKAVLPDPTHQHYRFRFQWQPGTIAVIHTHPANGKPEPSATDIDVAERFHVPMFTLTIIGMFLYDPATNVVSRVQPGLDWSIDSKWARYRR